jgi:hypothetical protein
MADRVHTLVESAQPSRFHSPIDVVGAQPGSEELRTADGAVLCVRQGGDHEVRVAFTAHIAV